MTHCTLISNYIIFATLLFFKFLRITSQTRGSLVNSVVKALAGQIAMFVYVCRRSVCDPGADKLDYCFHPSGVGKMRSIYHVAG